MLVCLIYKAIVIIHYNASSLTKRSHLSVTWHQMSQKEGSYILGWFFMFTPFFFFLTSRFPKVKLSSPRGLMDQRPGNVHFCPLNGSKQDIPDLDDNFLQWSNKWFSCLLVTKQCRHSVSLNLIWKGLLSATQTFLVPHYRRYMNTCSVTSVGRGRPIPSVKFYDHSDP
jgi:hypothetical protein